MNNNLDVADFSSPAPGRPKAGETPAGGRVPYSAGGGLS
jgi:hypothetical protein